MVTEKRCPICDSQDVQQHLLLGHSPIYQHPVPADSKVAPPYYLDIEYHWCNQCGHSFQAEYDETLLQSIYASHYYTPAPDGIGVTFRDQFFNALAESLLQQFSNKSASIMEIGSSSGETLEWFKCKLPHAKLLGIEPSRESADMARRRGIETRGEFFNCSTVKMLPKFDLVVTRHVIEHIADFKDFFTAINDVSHSDTLLCIETPSLDFAVRTNSIAPFHIEHLHVFSLYSLSCLCKKWGWIATQHWLTDSGNTVVLLKQQVKSESITRPEFSNRLQLKLDDFQNRLTKAIGNKKAIVWGAGAGGLTLINLMKEVPSFLVDGNPNKQHKHFVGMEQQVEYAPERISTLVSAQQQNQYVIVIGSTFYAEIRETLIQLGWQGAVISPYEWE